MKKTLMLALAVAAVLSCGARELQQLDGATLAAYGGNDGDSFKILHKGQAQIIRLYYVDCPETRATTEADNRRVREQARHFGLSDKNQIFRYGKAAAGFTEKQLSKPFTVHTAYADALGRSKGGRVYGFVTTSGGQNLADLLVENGYARAYGFRRALPDGTPQNEAAARLADKETVAALKRKGIWAQTDPDRLVELRAVSRLEEAELNAIAASETFNINTATEDELQTINGVGPATARRIIELRPFKNAVDLNRIPRLPRKTKSRIIERVTF